MAGLEKVRRERVPEKVRMDRGIQSATLCPMGDSSLHGTPAEAGAAVADEQGRFILQSQLGTGLLPGAKRFQCVTADRQDTFFVAFAGNPDRRVLLIDIADVEAGQLGEPEPR